MDRLPSDARRPLRIIPAALLLWPLLAASATAADTAPQIFKCTDGSGNVTYQNEPCPKNVKAGRIEIFDNRWSANKEEREAEWRRNASEHKLATGMPARWVREALGEPTEVRDTPTAGAAQLWIYKRPDRNVEVGMLNEQVLWFQETPVSTAGAAPAAQSARPLSGAGGERAGTDLPVTRLAPMVGEGPPAEMRAATPGAEPPRAAAEPSRLPVAAPAASPEAASAGAQPSAPRAVARGQDCKQALAGLGPPTRRRDVPALDAGSDPATEYFYESQSDGARLRIVCSNGKVEGVDRTVAR